jgi:hypothetical protein
MKRIMAILSFVFLLAPASATLANGNYRSAIDRQWARVEAAQKDQNERFKKLDREAKKAIMPLKDPSGSHATPGTVSPARQRQ